jgi:RHS repeat-associated protein
MKTKLLVAAVAAASLSLLATADANAQTGWCGSGENRVPPGGPGDGDGDKGGGGDSSSSCEESAGDPIEINYNGSQYHAKRDARIKGAVLDFDLYRTYISNVEYGADSPAFKETTLAGMHAFRSITKMEPDGHNREYSVNWKHSFQVYVSNFYGRYYTVVSETGKPYPFDRRNCSLPGDCEDNVAWPMDSADSMNRTQLIALYGTDASGEKRPVRFVWVREDGRRYYFRSCYDYAKDFRPELYQDVLDDCDWDKPESARLEKIVAADGVHTMTISYKLPTEASYLDDQGNQRWKLAHDCNNWQLSQVVMDNGVGLDFDYGACHTFTECYDQQGDSVPCDSPYVSDGPYLIEVPSLKGVRLGNDIDLVRYDYEVVSYGHEIMVVDGMPLAHDLVLSRVHHFSSGVYAGTETYDYEALGIAENGVPAKDSGYMKTIGAASTMDGPDEVTVLSVEYASAANGYFGDAQNHPDKFIQRCSVPADSTANALDEFFLYNCFIATGKDFRLFFDGGPRYHRDAVAPVLIDLVKGDVINYAVDSPAGTSAMVITSRTVDSSCSTCGTEFTYGDNYTLCPNEQNVPNLCGKKKRDGSYVKFKWDSRGNLLSVIKGLWDLDTAHEGTGVATNYVYPEYPADPQHAYKVDLFRNGQEFELPDNRLSIVSNNFNDRGVIYSYDPDNLMGRPLSKCESDGSEAYKTSYAYNTDWQVTSERLEERTSCLWGGDGTLVRQTDYLYYGGNSPSPDCMSSDTSVAGKLCKTIVHTDPSLDVSKALVTWYQSYDVYGNATDVIEPSGRRVMMSYDFDGKVRFVEASEMGGSQQKSRTAFAYDAAREPSEVRLPDGTRQIYSYTRIPGGIGPFITETARDVISETGVLQGTHRRSITSEYAQSGPRIPTRKVVHDTYTTPGQSVAKEAMVTEDKRRNVSGVDKTDVTAILNMDDTSKERLIFRDFGVTDLDKPHAVTVETTLFEDHTDARPNKKEAYIDEFGRTYKVRRVTTNQVYGSEEEAVTRYDFDNSGNLIKVTDANGNATEYAYDSFNRLISSIDPMGHKTEYTYDGRGLLVEKRTLLVDPADGEIVTGHTTYAYDLAGRLTQMSSYTEPDDMLGTEAGAVTLKYRYDTYGYADPGVCAGRFNALPADVLANGKGRTTIVGDGGITFLIYDGFGNLWQELRIQPGLDTCQATFYEHELGGNITKTVTPGGNEHIRQYLAGNVNGIDLKYAASGDAGPGTVSIAHSINWRIEGAIAGYAGLDGLQFKFDYSRAGYVSKIESTSGGNTLFSELIDPVAGRDPRHNIVRSVTDQKTHGYMYDGEQRLWTAYEGSVAREWMRQYSYDSIGNRATQYIENGLPAKMETYKYSRNDLNGNTEVIEEVVDPIVGPATEDGKSPLRLGFNYELSNLIKTCRDAAEKGAKHFFAHERCAGTVGADLREVLEKYKVDKAVFVRALLRDADFAKLFRDILKFRAVRDGVQNKDADLALVNSALDRLGAMNILNSVQTEEAAVAAAEQPAAGQIAPSIVYQHDRLGNVVKEAAYTVSNDVRNGGMVLCYDYDAMGRLAYISLDSSQNQVEIPWGVDLRDWVRDETCRRDLSMPLHPYVDAAELAAFSYDYKGRRIYQRYYAEPDKYFVFDKQDNLLSELANEGTTIKEYAWIGLKPVAQIVYGELQEQPAPGCSPSGGCQPTQCSMTGSDTGSFGQGLFYVLVFVVAPGLCYVVVRRGRGQPPGKRGRRAVIVLSTISLSAVALVFLQCTPTTYDKPVIFYYHNDHLETPMKMTDRAGKVAWEVTKKYPFGDFEYSAYTGAFKDAGDGGGTDVSGITPQNNLRFPGQYDGTDVRYYLNQGAKGPYYKWHRWYNPGTGRYLSIDPMRTDQGSFRYVMGNPVSSMDPRGLLMCNEMKPCMKQLSGCSSLFDASKDRITKLSCDDGGKECPDGPGTCEAWAERDTGVVAGTNKTTKGSTGAKNISDDCWQLAHELGHLVFPGQGEKLADDYAHQIDFGCAKKSCEQQ